MYVSGRQFVNPHLWRSGKLSLEAGIVWVQPAVLKIHTVNMLIVSSQRRMSKEYQASRKIYRHLCSMQTGRKSGKGIVECELSVPESKDLPIQFIAASFRNGDYVHQAVSAVYQNFSLRCGKRSRAGEEMNIILEISPFFPPEGDRLRAMTVQIVHIQLTDKTAIRLAARRYRIREIEGCHI